MRAALLLVTLLCVSIMPATAQRRGVAGATAAIPLEGVWQVMDAASGQQRSGLYIFTRTLDSTRTLARAAVSAATSSSYRATAQGF